MQLQGTKESTKIVDTKGLDKMTHNSGQVFMIRILPAESIFEEESTDVHLNIMTLPEEFYMLFGELHQLPPYRAPFDHKIPLQKYSNPINSRPYIYSSRKKDIIEQLLQEILDQGIVQPSYSPYASPVV